MLDLEQLKFPIGKFVPQDGYTADELRVFILRIDDLPKHLSEALKNLTDQQLDTPYREGGWTVRQVVHHVADSHMNAYIRFKWTLTEDNPTIKAYDEKQWAETPEASADAHLSLALIAALHAKWVALLNALSATDFQKTFVHPQIGKQLTLARMAALYAWHGEHHTAHITSLRARMNWA
jgi:uncharacterized damage-inducible protein DinB